MRLPFLVVLLMLFIVPALAVGNYEITAEPWGTKGVDLGKTSDLTYDASTTGMAIQRLMVDCSMGTEANFTLYYGDGSTVDGWMQYTSPSWGHAYTDVGIGSMSGGYSFTDLGAGNLIGRIDIVGYARNKTDNSKGIVIYDTIAGFSMGAVAFHPTGSGSSVIYKIHLVSNQPIQITAYINTRENVEKAASTSLLDVVNEWITFVLQFASVAKDFILGFFYWVQFFFISGWKVALVLILTVPMAFAAKKAHGNMDTFFRSYFKTLKGFFEFTMLVWHTFLDIIGIVRGWFRI